MLEAHRRPLIAQPIHDREWQVIAGDWDSVLGVRTVGFIEELGGTYEVDVLEQPELCQFFDTFKAAMDYFGRLEHHRDDWGMLHAGAA